MVKKKTEEQLNYQYSKKLWNHANKVFCDIFNGELDDDDDFTQSWNKFREILREYTEKIKDIDENI